MNDLEEENGYSGFSVWQALPDQEHSHESADLCTEWYGAANGIPMAFRGKIDFQLRSEVVLLERPTRALHRARPP
jgi:hypothetical protein